MKKTKKRDWLSWGFLTGGVFLGALAMLIYLYPTFFVGKLKSSSQVSPKVKGEVKAASSGSWEERWEVTKYRTVAVGTRRQHCWNLEGAPWNDDHCQQTTPGGCVGSIRYVGERRCCCATGGWESRAPKHGTLVLGPAQWTVSGHINGREFKETMTGEGWQNAQYGGSGVRGQYLHPGNDLDAEFFTVPAASGDIKMDAAFGLAGDNAKKRMVFSLGDYGYLSVIYGNFQKFRPEQGYVDGGGSWPTKWTVSGRFTD